MNNWIARVALFLVIGIGGAWSVYYTISHFKADRQLVLLNTTRPDFHRFLEIEKQHPAVFAKSDLKEYFDYFRLVTAAMPDNSDGALMLGYLDEIIGDHKRAEVLLRKALLLDPSFFFTTFNLAFILFEKGDYMECTDLLQKALVIPPESTFNRMMNSIIYRQFFAAMKDKQDIIVSLQHSYQEAYILLMESNSHDSTGKPQIHAHIM